MGFEVEGRETHILLVCGPMESKLIIFGGCVAKGNKTNIHIGYWGRGRRVKGNPQIF